MPTALPRSAEGEGPRAIGHLAEQLIAHARELILLVASDATLQYASPASESVLGARPETLVGRPLADLVHAADRRAVLSALAEARAAADRTASVVCRCRYADGGWRTLDASLRQAPGAPGLAGVVVVSTRGPRRRCSTSGASFAISGRCCDGSRGGACASCRPSTSTGTGSAPSAGCWSGCS